MRIPEQVTISLSQEMLRLSLSGNDWFLWSHWVVSELRKKNFCLPDFRRLKQSLKSELVRKLDLFWYKECCFVFLFFSGQTRVIPEGTEPLLDKMHELFLPRVAQTYVFRKIALQCYKAVTDASEGGTHGWASGRPLGSLPSPEQET